MKSTLFPSLFAPVLALLVAPLFAVPAFADDKPVGFTADVVPILHRTCVGCHKPGKLKGKLDVTTYDALKAGGETGPGFVPGDPSKSLLIEQITGHEPAMPPKGEPLKPAEVAILTSWVKQGAKDDTPKNVAIPKTAGVVPGPNGPTETVSYEMAPIIHALAYSPDGQTLAVAGRNEILLHKADGTGLVRRLPSGSPRTGSLAFSPDGKRLAAAGGAPGEFGQIMLWDTSNWSVAGNYKVSDDTLFGLNFSPTGDRLAVGCADKTVRVISATDGKEILKLDQHIDWAFGAVFSLDGTRIVSIGRDKNVKLTIIEDAAVIGDINESVEPGLCLARHPKKDLVVVGSATGGVRVYKFAAAELLPRSDEKKDPNRIKEIERQNGPLNAMAFSADGELLALASNNEARIYGGKDLKDFNRKVTLPGATGPVYAVAITPDGKQVATGGYDGNVRIFEVEKGKLLSTFVPVPVGK